MPKFTRKDVEKMFEEALEWEPPKVTSGRGVLDKLRAMAKKRPETGEVE